MKKIFAVILTFFLPAMAYGLSTAEQIQPGFLNSSGTFVPYSASNPLSVTVAGGSITGLGPCLSTASGTINTSNFTSQTISGSSATITSTDACGTLYIPGSNSNVIAVTSASAASAGLTTGFAVTIENHGTNTATWTASGSTINGAASFAVPTNTGCTFWSDGTNFQLFNSACSALPISSGNLPANVTYKVIGVTADGSGSAPATGVKGYFRVPFSGTITGWTLSSDASGSAVFDIWKSNNAIPTIVNTITAAALPTLSSQQYVTSTTLTSWTTSVSAGDVFGFNLNSASTLTRATLELYITTN